MKNPPKIQTSSQYDDFIFIQGNRPLNRKKIEGMKADILNGLNLLPYCPVIVNEKDGKFILIDGQHRYTTAKELELPVYFIASDNITLNQIATMNSKQDKWKESDFMNCYIQLGNEHYITLKEMCQKYKIGISIVAELLMYGNYKKRKETIIDFKEGRFTASFKELAIEILDLATSLFNRYVFYADRNLIVAIQMIKDKGLCDFNVLHEKLKSSPMLMDRQNSAKEYIYNIERVYNHRNLIRKVIY